MKINKNKQNGHYHTTGGGRGGQCHTTIGNQVKSIENEWKINRDPLKIFANWMINDKLIDAPGLEQIESEVQSEMEDSVQFALDAPYPDLNEVDKHVYA